MTRSLLFDFFEQLLGQILSGGSNYEQLRQICSTKVAMGERQWNLKMTENISTFKVSIFKQSKGYGNDREITKSIGLYRCAPGRIH